MGMRTGLTRRVLVGSAVAAVATLVAAPLLPVLDRLSAGRLVPARFARVVDALRAGTYPGRVVPLDLRRVRTVAKWGG